VNYGLHLVVTLLFVCEGGRRGFVLGAFVLGGLMSGGLMSYTLFTGVLTYADDLVLLAPSQRAMRQMHRICEDYGGKYDMLFNASKSKSIVCGPKFSNYSHIYCFMSRFYPRDVVSAVLATATWLAGCLFRTHRYCIKRAKPILKLFQPSASPIILVSSDLCAGTQFQG